MPSVPFDETNARCDWCNRPIPAPITVLKENSQLAFFIAADRVHLFKKTLPVPTAPIKATE